MKYLSITENRSVKKDEILSVERSESGLARVELLTGFYDTNFPYETILQMLEIPDIEEKVKNSFEPMTREQAYHRPMQYYAG